MKQYTVQQLAQLAGVSVRTLHWYHAIGLLSPHSITNAGYRIYTQSEVDTLQTILFYRALGMPCKEIAVLLAQPDVSRLTLLEQHRIVLLEKQAQLNTLLQTLDTTIRAEKGELTMTNEQKFAGLANQVQQNEEKYGAEVRQKYGDEVIDGSNKKMMGLSETQYNAMQTLGAQINIALAAAVQAKENPAGEEGRRIAAMHRDWLGYTWPKYTKQAHAGVAKMYVADERFTAYYDSEVAGCAQFLCDAITAFVQ